MHKWTKWLALLLVAAVFFGMLPVSVAVQPGYETVEFQDFEGSGVWGFSGNFTASRQDTALGGNSTGKLRFAVSNQSGTRTSTKTFANAVGGAQIEVEFDWYPEAVNAKGENHAAENGMCLNIRDGAGKTIFGICYTNGYPITYYFGADPHGGSNNFAPEDAMRAATGFTETGRWYHIDLVIDNAQGTIAFTITDAETGISETHTAPLVSVDFDGTVKSLAAVGLRTSANNITATQYIDNFGIYNVPTESNVIFSVVQPAYKTIYVGTAGYDIASIGLPNEVSVTLADRSVVSIPVAQWESLGAWNPYESGVYAFQGTLAETDYAVNAFGKTVTMYLYNRLQKVSYEREMEWLDRGLVAVQAEEGQFLSWRLLASEYDTDITFNVYRNGVKLNASPLRVTNYLDAAGQAGDGYVVQTILNGEISFTEEVTGQSTDYLAIPLQIPDRDTSPVSGVTVSYSAGSCNVGDVDGDGEYEIFVKWVPSNSMDSASRDWNNQTIFDCYKLDGTLLWRMHMGNNLSSGEHYNQYLVADFDGDGRSEFFVKTADGTTVYGATDGMVDYGKVLSVIGDASMDGYYMGKKADSEATSDKPGVRGHVWGGPEYVSMFDGETGQVIDTINYRFSIESYPTEAWGDTSYNRSDRFLAGVATMDGIRPSAILGRGYYSKTTAVQYNLVNGRLVEVAYYDSSENNRVGENKGAHSLSVADVDNDGCDEIIYGSLTLDNDMTVLYSMDGQMGRVQGSHGDALHVGAFSPYNDDAISVMMVFEDTNVASMQVYDGATGETQQAYYANKDTGRGVAANITANPGYEFWGAAGSTAATGGAVYNVTGSASFAKSNLSQNFTVYWTGDLLQELLDGTSITKVGANYSATTIKSFSGCASNNGTKAVPGLTADILGDWREEVVMRTTDSRELRIYTTTIPTEYRIYTLMHDSVYRAGVARQNVGYNQPNHVGFYIGEDTLGRARVLNGTLPVPTLTYTSAPAADIPVTGVVPGNGQANVNFPIVSANGKGYTLYLSTTGELGSFMPYGDVNYNSQGAHIKKLNNGQTYYVYIEYAGGGITQQTPITKITPSK